MSSELPPEKVERLEYFLKGDRHALLFCLDLLWIAHVWDDLIDKDKVLSDEVINQTFLKSLASIPSNPFYQQCQAFLMPMIFNAIVLWLEANELKRGNLDQKAVAFCLDNAVIEIIHFCILLKGQSEWARENAPEFWQLFGPTAGELTVDMED